MGLTLPYIFIMESNQQSAGIDDSLFQRVINFFLGVSDPERMKKRELRQIKAQLKKRSKFFKVNGSLIQPPIAKFFYEIYQVTGPAGVILEKMDLSGVIKNVIIDHYLTDEEIALRDKLSDESIRARADEMGVNAMANAVKDDLAAFYELFEAERVKRIEQTFNQLKMFVEFVNFDYYFLLKKFDSGIPEGDFVYRPRFEAINGEYLLDDLKDFLEVLPYMNKDADWDGIIDILSHYRDVEVVARDGWKKVVKLCREMHKSQLLLIMVRFLDQNPEYSPVGEEPDERIVDEYLQMFKTQTELSIQKVSQERKNQQVEKLLNQIFGTTAVSRTKNYTEKANLSFSKKMMGGYLHVEPVNYLKAFFLDFYKRDMRQLSDILLIRGQWATNVMSQQFSEAYHQLLQISEQIVQFDEDLGEEGERGVRIKSLILKADKDKEAVARLRKMLKELNDEALLMVQKSTSNLVTLGKVLKQLIGDYKAEPHEIILNWKGLQSASDEDLGEKMTNTYKKIYYFVRLMQNYVKTGKKG